MKSLFTKHCLGCVRSSGDLLYKNVNDLKSKQEKQVCVATDKNQTAITWTAGWFKPSEKLKKWNDLEFSQSHFQGWLTERISLLAPRRRMVQALGSLHSVINVKYSSPIFLISNRPAPVPTSSSLSSSGRLIIRAPQALLIRWERRRNQMISDTLTHLPSP